MLDLRPKDNDHHGHCLYSRAHRVCSNNQIKVHTAFFEKKLGKRKGGIVLVTEKSFGLQYEIVCYGVILCSRIRQKGS